MMDLIFDPTVWEVEDAQLMKETLRVKAGAQLDKKAGKRFFEL